MIVSIDPTNTPFVAELRFPHGLPKGQKVTLLVGEEGQNDRSPTANGIRVDPLTKIVHIWNSVRDGERVDCSKSEGLIACDNEEHELGSAEESLGGATIDPVTIELSGASLEVFLYPRSKNLTRMLVRQGSHGATIALTEDEPSRLIMSCWESVPQSSQETFLQMATEILSRNFVKPPKIASDVSILANGVRRSNLEVLEIESAVCVQPGLSARRNLEEFIDSVLVRPAIESTPETNEKAGTILTDQSSGMQAEAVETLRRPGLRTQRRRKAKRKTGAHSDSDGNHDENGMRHDETEDAEGRDGDCDYHDDYHQADDVDEDADDESTTAVTRGSEKSSAGENDKIYCLVCLKINRRLRFTNTQALQTHMSSNHSVQIVEAPECSKCSKRFVSIDALQAHEKKCNPKFPKKCQICSKSFAMGLHRDRHMREMHGIIKEHSCGFCGQKYQSEKHRDWHLVTKHKDALSPGEMERLGMEEILCTLCDFKTYSSKGMQVHRQKEHIENEKAFRCPACGVGDDSLSAIQEHIAHRHGVDDRWWVCQFCNRTFGRDSEDAIAAHLDNHSSKSGATCTHCNKVFENDSILYDHTNRNHQKPNIILYVCDICDQGSESYKELLKHMLKHNPFKKSLYRLQRQHIMKRNIEEGVVVSAKREKRSQPSSETAHRCETCHKRFDLEATLRAHRIVFHSDPGKEFYRCPDCSKAFKPHHLSYHLRLHSGERPHNCQYCDASFHTVASCSDHEIVKHTFAYKLWCPLCKKGFVSRAKTWQHLVRFHKESPEAADRLLPPVTHKVLNILQKRRRTEEMKLMLDSDIVETSLSNDASRRKAGSSLQEQKEAESDSEESREIMEITDESLAYGDSEILEVRRFEVGEEPQLEQLPGVPMEFPQIETAIYPQPEIGPDYYRIVLPDGSQTSLRIEPGQQVLLEDENGHRKLIDMTPHQNHPVQ